MYAIVEIAGQQFKVEKDSKIFVHRLAQNEGESVDFDKVLMVDNNGAVTVGAPTVEGAKVVYAIFKNTKLDGIAFSCTETWGIIFNKYGMELHSAGEYEKAKHY